MDARHGPIRETLVTFTHIIASRVRQCCLLMSFQEGLECDCVRDRVQWCHFFNIFFKKVHTRICFYKENKIVFKNLKVRCQTL